MLAGIARLAADTSWCDRDARKDDLFSEDQVAHVTGLIWRRATEYLERTR